MTALVVPRAWEDAIRAGFGESRAKAVPSRRVVVPLAIALLLAAATVLLMLHD